MPYVQLGPDTYASSNPKVEATTLPAGVYNSGTNNGMAVLHRQDVKKDELVPLPGTASRAVVLEIQKFWNKREHYDRLGVVHKRGILLVGPPGCGKTSTVAFIVDEFLRETGGVVINIHDVDFVHTGLNVVRTVEPERPIMVLIEDFEDALRRGNESRFLNVVDGRDQVSGVVFVATTNHLDQLPPRIVNRPSRFDVVVTMGMPSADARRAFLRAKSSLDPGTIDRLVAGSEQWSIAHLKEALILLEVYERGVDESVGRMNKLIGRKMAPADIEQRPALGQVAGSGDLLEEVYRRTLQSLTGEDGAGALPALEVSFTCDANPSRSDDDK